MSEPTASHDLTDPLLMSVLKRQLHNAGGWIGFDRFMALALYTPGLGYYANQLRKFGTTPASGSDFVTAPEMSPWLAARWRAVWPKPWR